MSKHCQAFISAARSRIIINDRFQITNLKRSCGKNFSEQHVEFRLLLRPAKQGGRGSMFVRNNVGGRKSTSGSAQNGRVRETNWRNLTFLRSWHRSAKVKLLRLEKQFSLLSARDGFGFGHMQRKDFIITLHLSVTSSHHQRLDSPQTKMDSSPGDIRGDSSELIVGISGPGHNSMQTPRPWLLN